MKIGNIDYGNRPLFLAPMEDVTDVGFRMLCKRYGAAMVYTEFVAAEAIIRSIKATLSKMTINEEELKTLQDRIDVFAKASLSFVFAGVNNTMNTFNGK
jgi:tRNA-dihydrouridine synthase